MDQIEGVVNQLGRLVRKSSGCINSKFLLGKVRQIQLFGAVAQNTRIAKLGRTVNLISNHRGSNTESSH